MKITREECCETLRKIIVKNANKKTWVNENKKALQDKYGLPDHAAIDLLTKVTALEILDDQSLYCLTDVLIGDGNFTPLEMEMFGSYKYSEHKAELPLVFDAIKISDDSFAAVTSAKQLERFSDAKMVRYNEKTQRPKKFKGGKFKIQLNMRSVNKMKKRFLNNEQIPNFLTFNIPETAEWYYDANEKQLVITDIDAFDIVDGYHRWVALMKSRTENSNFDYPMGLLITYFNLDKAQNFVDQENQKNKLNFVDAKSLNPESPANQIVALLRRGMLANGIFGDQYLATAINIFYLRDAGKDQKCSKSDLIAFRNKIYDFIEEYSFRNPEILETTWGISFTYCLIAASTFDKEIPYSHVVKCSKKIKDKNRYTRREIAKILEEVGAYER